MDAKYLAEIRAREQAATPGPWEWNKERYYPGYTGIIGKDNAEVLFPNHCNDGDEGAAWFEDFPSEQDAEFIAHARTDIPALIAEVERLTIENLGLKDAAIRCDGYEKRYHAALTELDAKDQQIATLAEANKNLKKLYRDARDSNIFYAKRNATLKKALSDMLFAYQNKDGDCPHQFEIEAVHQAEQLTHETHGDALESEEKI